MEEDIAEDWLFQAQNQALKSQQPNEHDPASNMIEEVEEEEEETGKDVLFCSICLDETFRPVFVEPCFRK